MPPAEIQRRNLADHLLRRLAPFQQITSPQAKLYSHAIRLSWRAAGLPSWSKDEEVQQLRDAERLIETARILSELGDAERSKVAYRRAADLLEWLSRARRPTSQDSSEEEPIPLALLAAASYQLADLPAMARGLLHEKRLPTNTGKLFAAFLRADFTGVLGLAIDYWKDRLLLTESNGSWLKLETGGRKPHDEILSSEVVRCLGLIAQSLRLDDRQRLELSTRKLLGLSKLTARTAEPYVWLTTALTGRVAERYVVGSLWRWTELLTERISAEGQEVMANYVRFQYRHGRGLLWPSQQEGVRRLATGSSFAMCTPTGSGKTTIAELAILRTLYAAQSDNQAKGIVPLVMYLVPSRALAAEVEARLAFDIKSNDQRVTITGLYGGAEWSLTDRWLMATGPTVLVCTVEMAESLLRYVGPFLIPRLQLIIVDEAHQVQFNNDPYSWRTLRSSENRAARLEQFAARLFTNAPDCPAIALSAVAGGAEQAIARWVSRDPAADALGTSYRSTRQLVGALECRADGGTRIRLELVDGRPLTLSDRAEEAYIPIPFDRMPRLTGELRTDLGKFVQCHTLWAAIQLARAGRSVLVSIPQRIEGRASAN